MLISCWPRSFARLHHQPRTDTQHHCAIWVKQHHKEIESNYIQMLACTTMKTSVETDCQKLSVLLLEGRAYHSQILSVICIVHPWLSFRTQIEHSNIEATFCDAPKSEEGDTLCMHACVRACVRVCVCVCACAYYLPQSHHMFPFGVVSGYFAVSASNVDSRCRGITLHGNTVDKTRSRIVVITMAEENMHTHACTHAHKHEHTPTPHPPSTQTQE